jgi:hypothetical protein
MGCCCSLFGGGAKKDANESRSILMSSSGGNGRGGSDTAKGESETSPLKGPKYYQAIIDDANSKFLNVPSQPRKKTLKDLDSIRLTLTSIDTTVPCPSSPPAPNVIARNCNPDITSHNRSVVNVLSESVIVSDRFDAAVSS